MPGLGDTVFDLLQRQKLQAEAERNGPGRLQEETPSGSNPGALRMLTFVPPGLGPLAPLVVVLHGCGQTAEGFDHGSGWSTLAGRHGFALLFVEQTRANNANLCFNWFQPEDVTSGSGEALSIRQMIEQSVTTHGLNPARVYITGLSAGGAMAGAMLATAPDLFAGAAIIAGLPYGAAYGMQAAFEAMGGVRTMSGPEWGDLVRNASSGAGVWPPVQIWHGGADSIVRPAAFDELVKQWSDVLGVAGAPATEKLGAALHHTWRAKSGSLALEAYFIPGLGHGVPLDTASDDVDQSVGVASPFMLEAGISSTYRTARSWGLLTQAARKRGPADDVAEPARDMFSSVADLIDDALRAVGLKG